MPNDSTAPAPTGATTRKRHTSDAAETVRFAFLDAIASTYGLAAEALVDALVARASDASVAWAFAELAAPPLVAEVKRLNERLDAMMGDRRPCEAPGCSLAGTTHFHHGAGS